ncbi:MAG: hypothetical protein GKR94_27755 [Gammaproteobacteria bacterium]|nr:hypothetical protein [Gammaproteobacteria bacterium]
MTSSGAPAASGSGVTGVDDDRRWRQREAWLAVDEALWRASIAFVQGALFIGDGVVVAAGQPLLRCEACKPGVMMVKVVPIKVGLTPLTSVSSPLESPRLVGLIVCALELRFTESVIVAHPRSAVAEHYTYSHSSGRWSDWPSSVRRGLGES